MTNLNDAIELLQAKRLDLLTQLSAVDEAIAALTSAVVATAISDTAVQTPADPEPAPATPPEVVPTRIKSRRILTDEHKYALSEGRRKAHHLAEVKAGRARERVDIVGAKSPHASSQPPRLVARKTQS